MIMNKSLWGQDVWKDTLTVFLVLAHKVLTPPGNQEAAALAWA